MSSTIGIDLGGTKIAGVLLDDNNKIRKKVVRLTEANRKREEILKNILDVIELLKTPEVKTVGLGVPGLFDKTGKITKMTHIPHLVGFNLKKEIEKHTGLKVALDNDANCFAFAESSLGAGRNHASVVGIIIGTGVGVAMIQNGKVVNDPKIGATRFTYTGKKNNIINVENLIAGPALLTRYKELSARNVDSIKNLSWFDKNYRKTYYEFTSTTGLFFSHVIETLKPEIIIVGGGVSNINFYRDVQKEIKKHTSLNCEVQRNTLGDDAGALGAAIIARNLQ